MNKADIFNFFNIVLSEGLGRSLEVLEVIHQSGGSISQAAIIKTREGHFFLKWKKALGSNPFVIEQQDLNLLRLNTDLKIPEILAFGETEGRFYLLIEAIDVGSNTPAYWESLGVGMAHLHRKTAQEHGLSYNNHIGRLEQKNAFKASWHEFFITMRLNVQLELALKNKLVDSRFSRKFTHIYKTIPHLIPDLPPSLLHGDLWSGNILATSRDKACLIDPAIYYGSREIEIAFTYLFGGFDPLFYESYTNTFPLMEGFEERVPIYNLYPLMVHANMFGATYLNAVESIIDQFR